MKNQPLKLFEYFVFTPETGVPILPIGKRNKKLKALKRQTKF